MYGKAIIILFIFALLVRIVSEEKLALETNYDITYTFFFIPVYSLIFNGFILFQVAFMPFLSTEDIASLVLDGTIHFDLTIREYFLVSSRENFVLPNILHKYCVEPLSYDISTKELQLYLYFNQVCYMQRTGLRYEI